MPNNPSSVRARTWFVALLCLLLCVVALGCPKHGKTATAQAGGAKSQTISLLAGTDMVPVCPGDRKAELKVFVGDSAVADGESLPPARLNAKLTWKVTFSGGQPTKPYRLQWWKTDTKGVRNDTPCDVEKVSRNGDAGLFKCADQAGVVSPGTYSAEIAQDDEKPAATFSFSVGACKDCSSPPPTPTPPATPQPFVVDQTEWLFFRRSGGGSGTGRGTGATGHGCPPFEDQFPAQLPSALDGYSLPEDDEVQDLGNYLKTPAAARLVKSIPNLGLLEQEDASGNYPSVWTSREHSYDNKRGVVSPYNGKTDSKVPDACAFVLVKKSR